MARSGSVGEKIAERKALDRKTYLHNYYLKHQEKMKAYHKEYYAKSKQRGVASNAKP